MNQNLITNDSPYREYGQPTAPTHLNTNYSPQKVDIPPQNMGYAPPPSFPPNMDDFPPAQNADYPQPTSPIDYGTNPYTIPIQQEPQQVSVVIPPSRHFRSLFLTILVVIAIIIKVVLMSQSSCFSCSYCSRDCSNFFQSTGGLIVILVLYLIYLIECCCAGSLKFLSNQVDINQFQNLIDSMKRSPPVLTVSIRCYHTEIYYETVTHTRSDGSTYTTEESRTREVTTFTGSEDFSYASWEDVTGMPVGMNPYRLTKLNIKKRWQSANPETANSYQAFFKDFVDKHKYRDDHYSTGESYNFAGYIDKTLVKNGDIPIPALLGSGWYLLFSFFLMTWPYRLWFENLVETRQITSVKTVNIFPKNVQVIQTVLVCS